MVIDQKEEMLKTLRIWADNLNDSLAAAEQIRKKLQEAINLIPERPPLSAADKFFMGMVDHVAAGGDTLEPYQQEWIYFLNKHNENIADKQEFATKFEQWKQRTWGTCAKKLSTGSDFNITTVTRNLFKQAAGLDSLISTCIGRTKVVRDPKVYDRVRLLTSKQITDLHNLAKMEGIPKSKKLAVHMLELLLLSEKYRIEGCPTDEDVRNDTLTALKGHHFCKFWQEHLQTISLPDLFDLLDRARQRSPENSRIPCHLINAVVAVLEADFKQQVKEAAGSQLTAEDVEYWYFHGISSPRNPETYAQYLISLHQKRAKWMTENANPIRDQMLKLAINNEERSIITSTTDLRLWQYNHNFQNLSSHAELAYAILSKIRSDNPSSRTKPSSKRRRAGNNIDVHG